MIIYLPLLGADLQALRRGGQQSRTAGHCLICPASTTIGTISLIWFWCLLRHDPSEISEFCTQLTDSI